MRIAQKKVRLASALFRGISTLLARADIVREMMGLRISRDPTAPITHVRIPSAWKLSITVCAARVAGAIDVGGQGEQVARAQESPACRHAGREEESVLDQGAATACCYLISRVSCSVTVYAGAAEGSDCAQAASAESAGARSSQDATRAPESRCRLCAHASTRAS